MKSLQSEWKNAGAALRSEEQKLWKKFRGYFDAFFEAKKKFEAGAKDREAANAKAKEELIAKLNSFKKGKDPEKDKQQILEWESAYAKVGFVPKGHKEKLESTFKKAAEKVILQQSNLGTQFSITKRSFSANAVVPGKSEAVCTSSPIPRITASSCSS